MAVTQLDQTTQHNAATVEESTATSHLLSKEATTLQDMIRNFDVGETRDASSDLRLRDVA